MQAFIYCRVSSEEQATDNHYSLDNQEQKAREYVQYKGWRIADIRKDVASGKDAGRDGYRDLITAINDGKIDVVIVYRLDRLSRNVRDIYDFLDLIKQKDVAFVSLSESFDTTTAMGRAMLGVAAVFAQLTREMIAENVKDGLMRRAQSGLYIGNMKGPMGYRYDSQAKTLVPVSEEAERVRLIYSLFTDRKWGVGKIVGYLNQEQIPSRSDGSWFDDVVARILRNPVYIGKIRWHDQVMEAGHEPIISPDVFQAAQEIIGSRKTLPGRTHQSQHLLSGVAECGACGKRLVAHYGPARKSGERYRFYFHRTRGQRDECKSFYRSADKLEKIVVNELKRAAESNLLSKMAMEELHRQTESKTKPLQDRRETVVAELVQIKEKFNNWADRLDRGLIDEDQFAQQNTRLMERKKEIQDEQDKIELELAECEDIEVSFEAARQALETFPAVWEHLEIEEQRELVRLLIERFEVNKDHVTVKVVFLPEVSIKI